MKNSYNTTVTLQCGSCGSTNLESKDKSYVKCNNCNREYLGGEDELVKANQRVIKRMVERKADEIAKNFADDLMKAFKGNKNFRIR